MKKSNFSEHIQSNYASSTVYDQCVFPLWLHWTCSSLTWASCQTPAQCLFVWFVRRSRLARRWKTDVTKCSGILQNAQMFSPTLDGTMSGWKVSSAATVCLIAEIFNYRTLKAIFFVWCLIIKRKRHSPEFLISNLSLGVTKINSRALLFIFFLCFSQNEDHYNVDWCSCKRKAMDECCWKNLKSPDNVNPELWSSRVNP